MATLMAHDIEIGEFSNVAVNSSVLGHVQIGDGVNIAPVLSSAMAAEVNR